MSEEQQPMEIASTGIVQLTDTNLQLTAANVQQMRDALRQFQQMVNPEIIVARNPLTNAQIQFQASNVQRIAGSEHQHNRDRAGHENFHRSHYAVCLLRNQNDEIKPDAEAWYYDFLDQNNQDNQDGDLIARYDRGHDQHWQDFLARIEGFTLMSFEDWKENTTRIEGRGAANGCTVYTNEEVQTFETFVQAHCRRLERNHQYELQMVNSS